MQNVLHRSLSLAAQRAVTEHHSAGGWWLVAGGSWHSRVSVRRLSLFIGVLIVPHVFTPPPRFSQN